jgi:hypothetical protein
MRFKEEAGGSSQEDIACVSKRAKLELVRAYSPEEDAAITHLVLSSISNSGAPKWTIVAAQLNKTLLFSERTADQLRCRYLTKLDPNVRKAVTAVEKAQIVRGLLNCLTVGEEGGGRC